MTNPTLASGSNHIITRIFTFRGCIATGDPWDDIQAASKDPASTTTTFPSVTTTVADCLIALIASHDLDSQAGNSIWSGFTNANLSDLTLRLDVSTDLGNGGGICLTTGGKASAGVTGTTTATCVSSVNGALTIALKPPVTGDTTAPTLSGAATATDGATITATLSESGCVADGGGTSGTGGFTLSGTSATVASWAISGTTLTLTLSGTVLSTDTVTYAYARSTTTDDIKDAAGNYLADFSGVAVTNNVSGAVFPVIGDGGLVTFGPVIGRMLVI
jgi:hypothetical protein